MTALQSIRALYRANKKRTIRSVGVITTCQSKADIRAREFLERIEKGETQQQIADSLSIDRSSVSFAIARYRKRHPDITLGVGVR